MRVSLATVAHDPRNVLVPKLREFLPQLNEVFSSIGVMASVSATDETVAVLQQHGAIVERETLPDGTDTIGRRRRGSLAVALRTAGDYVVYSDMDHIMRWIGREPENLREVLATLTEADFTVIGRTPEVFDEAPAPLRETEGLCNRFYERLTGRRWELFIAVRGMSRATAERIVDGCHEDTIGTDVAWPLFAEAIGLSLGYAECRLPYENHTWFASGVSEKARVESSPRSWSLRFRLASQMMDAFERWGPSPAE